MKKLIIITLSLFSVFTSFADGGYQNGFNLEEFDQTQNVLLKTTRDTIKFINSKGKDDFEIESTNLLIYNLKTAESNYLFPLGSKEEIRNIIFETKIDSSGILEFNNDNSGYNHNVKNNHDIKRKELNDLLIIVTYSRLTKKETLWTSTKTGTDLKKIKEYDPKKELLIDVYNELFLFMDSSINNVEIEQIKY